MSANKKERLVAAIKNGTVIDHIPADKTFQVVALLELQTLNEPISIGRCNNPKCITNNEPMQTVFHVVDKVSRTLKCHYCDMEQAIDKAQLV